MSKTKPTTCPKAPHTGTGHLHAVDDDGPYYVDGLEYCGRCHRMLPHADHSEQREPVAIKYGGMLCPHAIVRAACAICRDPRQHSPNPNNFNEPSTDPGEPLTAEDKRKWIEAMSLLRTEHEATIADLRATIERLEYADLATERTIADLRAKMAEENAEWHEREEEFNVLDRKVDELQAKLAEREAECDAALKRVEELEAGLRSIAANTCCDRCQEAALVARSVLAARAQEKKA